MTDWHPLLNLQSEVFLSSDRSKRSARSNDEHLIVDLNSFYEIDHLPGTVKINRIDRVLGLFDLEHLPVTFKLPIPEKNLEEARKLLPETRAWIAVSVRRTRIGECRTPNEDLVAKVCRELSKDFGIYVIEGHDSIPWAQEIGAVVQARRGLLDTTAAMSLCEVLLTPDSGSLWLGHTVEKPMVTWMGPTPGKIKCSRHALWPDGLRVIQTNDWINCPACFEYEEACEWKHKCMTCPDPERFVKETVSAVHDLVSDSGDPAGMW